MERVGMTQTGRALAYIKDALDEMGIVAETDIRTSRQDIIKGKRFYNLPSECLKLLDVRCKDHNNADSKWRSIPRSIYEPEIVDEATPVLSTSQTSFHFAGPKNASETATFIITNGDPDGSFTKALEWSITGDSWLTFTPPSGTTTTESETITITAVRSGLSLGMTTGSVDITSNGGDKNLPATINTQPTVVVSKSSLDFGEISSGTQQDTFEITNAWQVGTLNYTVSSSNPWCTIDVASGDATIEADTITVTVNRDHATIVDLAVYTAVITVEQDPNDGTSVEKIDVRMVAV